MLHTRLTPIDHFPPGNYATCCFYLPLRPHTTPSEAFAALKEGLRRTFAQLPWLGGKIYPMSAEAQGWRPGNLEIRYDPEKLDEAISTRLIFKELSEADASYAGLQEDMFSTDSFPDEELIWAPALPDVTRGAECLVAQANFLPGVCLLCVAVNHYATDGTGGFDIWKLWADNCSASQAGVALGAGPPPESSDRGVLERIWERERTGRPLSDVDAVSWRMLDLQPPGSEKDRVQDTEGYKSAAANMPQETMRSAIFYIPPAAFANLSKATSQEASAEPGQISSNDALCGLFWRCLLKARRAAAANAGLDVDGAQARLYLTLDARPDFSHDLPSPYLGNLSVMNLCDMPLVSLTSADTSVGSVSLAIRSVADAAQKAALMDAYAVARGMGNLADLTLRGSSIRGFDMLLTSLLGYPLQNICFGGRVFDNQGRPEAFRPLMGSFNRFSRLCFFLPRKKHGGVEVIVNLFDDEMELLLQDEEFGQYAVYLTS
ncbi:hypothetical protein CcaCcLH18_05737 [Colletotrichum camelliae]|nr:hypothetical protein CcaCcLH18_05737 [Colletotrichum camelliae]